MDHRSLQEQEDQTCQQYREATTFTPTRPVASVSRDDGELPVDSTSLFSTPGLLFDESAMDFGDGAQAMDEAGSSDESSSSVVGAGGAARGAEADLEDGGDSDSADDFLLMDMVSPGTARAASHVPATTGGSNTAVTSPSLRDSGSVPAHRSYALPANSVIDFANTCVWGAPVKSHKTVEFYAQLICELQGQPGGQGNAHV
jgi:hypothetical protein